MAVQFETHCTKGTLVVTDTSILVVNLIGRIRWSTQRNTINDVYVKLGFFSSQVTFSTSQGTFCVGRIKARDANALVALCSQPSRDG